MPFDLPEGGGGTITNITNILTKIPDGLKSLRDGSAITYGGVGNLNTIGGTADAIVLTTDKFPFTSYADGHNVNIFPSLPNTGAMTIALDGLPPKLARKRRGNGFSDFSSSEVPALFPVTFRYSGHWDAWILSENNPENASNNLSNTFTQNQEISKVDPQLDLIHTGFGERGRFIKQGAQVFMAYNAKRVSGAWEFDITSEQAWLIGGFGGIDSFQVYRAPPSLNPPVFTLIYEVDSTGKQTQGAVPLARIEGEERSTAIDFGATPSLSGQVVTITGYTGLNQNDYVLVTMDPSPSNSFLAYGNVSSSTEVRIIIFNVSGISIDLPLTTFFARVIKRL